MAGRRNLHRTGKPENQTANLVALIFILVVIVIVVLPLFPALGIPLGISVGATLFREARKQNILKKDLEGKYSVDWNRGKAAFEQSAREMKTQSKETARRVKTRISESDRMEEHQPYEHAHNPVNYSYDACAAERRLEQIKSLKDAGILDEKEYQQRKARILAGK